MLRQPLHRIPAYRDVVLKFYNAYIDLAVHLVKLDTRRLENARLAADGGTQHPIALLFSGPFMKQVYVLTHRNAAADIESNNTILEAYGTPGDDISMFMDKLESCSEDILCLLSDFATALADALSASPKLIEAVGPLAHVVNNVLEETATRNETEATDISPETSVLIARLQQGHRLFDTLSGVVSDLLNKHVSQITKDGIENSITSLSELLMTSLTGPHDAAVAMVQDHTAKHPEVPPELTAEAIALEWRLGMMERLIRCSQMQLRVTGAVSLCSELVSLWKRLAEDSDNALLKHVAHRLHDSGLIDYIIGPNSHPEIIIESGNVVGFLMVTKMYRPEHTDRLWQAMTGNLDLRAGEATIRMLSNIVGLFDYTAMEYLCAKFDNLPIANFTPLLRQLWDNLLLHMVSKYRQQHDHLTYQPYALCLRLVRESSVLVNGKASNQGLQSMATQKLSDILQYGPDVSGREKLYRDCLQDLSLKTPTTLGSLWCLWMTIRSNIAHEMHILAQEHDLARLLVGELEHAVEVGAANSSVDAVVPVVSGPANHPRLEFLANLIRYEPNSIVTADGTCDGEGDDKPKGPSLDRKLWDLLVGPQSLSREDREAGWKIFNNSRGDAQVKNAFIRTCTTNHLPTLPASCFCEGTLEFVRWEAHALVRMTDGFSLDDEPATRSSCLEQLWRLILESPDARIAARAISIMITEVYLDSDLLLKYPARQTRQVHSSLTTRCLSQLKDAAAHIRNPLGESAPAQDLESSLQKQKLIFGRSLQFLRHFLDSYQSKPELSAPDVRAISRRTPSEVSGDLAQLKYQSFDGVHHTDVKPLRIGLRNTAGSLLASIRRETGFDSYKAYYRGQRFWPTERDVSLSLEDLNIQEGLILVRREEDDDDQSSGKDGEAGDESLMTMSLSEEILSHFQEMWGYLDMEEDVAREV